MWGIGDRHIWDNLLIDMDSRMENKNGADIPPHKNAMAGLHQACHTEHCIGVRIFPSKQKYLSEAAEGLS